MKIEIRLTKEETKQILCAQFVTQYPGKIVTVEDLTSYSGATITVSEPPQYEDIKE